MRPGFDVILRDEPVPRSGDRDTLKWFAVGPTEFGPLEPKRCTSPDEVTRKFGGPTSTSSLPDTVREFFAEGGAAVVIKRVVGPAAVVATKSFNDNAATPTLRIDAAAPGAWYNRLRPAIVIDGANFRITVDDTNDQGVLLVDSPPFATKAEAVAFFAEHELIRVVSLAPATLPVAAAAAVLVGGADDIGGIANAQYEAGLDALSKQLGPGQVSIPGATSAALHTAVLAHAGSHNRRAVLDLPDSADDAVVKTAAQAHKNDPNARFGAAFGPWDVVPGALAGTTKKVPPSGRVAGTIARVDAQVGHPNQPAAGRNGVSLRVLSLTQTYTDDEYEEMNEAGANMSRTVFGNDVQIYGFRTLVDPDVDPRWVEFSGSRTVMYVTAESNSVMAEFAFDQIDGRGHKFSELEGALSGVCLDLYNPPKNALYGSSPQEAYRVDASAAVNTPESVQARNLRAVVAIRTSPFAEYIVTEIVRRMVTERV